MKKKNVTGEKKEERTHIRFNGVSRMGRSSVDIECPFCGEVCTGYIWSLAGSGKKCSCGAIHYNNCKSVLWA